MVIIWPGPCQRPRSPLKVTPVLTPIQYPVTISIPIRIFTGTSQQSSAESLIVVRSQKCLPGELSFAQAPLGNWCPLVNQILPGYVLLLNCPKPKMLGSARALPSTACSGEYPATLLNEFLAEKTCRRHRRKSSCEEICSSASIAVSICLMIRPCASTRPICQWLFSCCNIQADPFLLKEFMPSVIKVLSC